MENNRQTIEVLNDLIQISNDRIVAYEKAIRQTSIEDTDLKILYASMVAEGHRMKISLAIEVHALGAEIEHGNSTSGKIYLAWMDVKAIFTGHNRQTVLANCESGEQAVQRAYRMALNHDLSTHIRELLTRQQEALYDSIGEIRATRNSLA
jgi:uncharacterized protein (TIGR02284 family)